MSLKNDPKAYKVVGCAMKVHDTLGNGFLESAYGDALEVEFKAQGVPYKREDEIKIFYCGTPLKTTYRADFTCYDGSLIVELKALKKIGVIEAAQTIHYLRATEATSAVLINFGAESLQYDYFPESFKHPQRKAQSQNTNPDYTEACTNVSASPVSDPQSDISLRSVSGASAKSGFLPSGAGTNPDYTEACTNVPASPVSDPRSDISLRSVSGASAKSGFLPSGTARRPGTNPDYTEACTNVPANTELRSVSGASAKSGFLPSRAPTGPNPDYTEACTNVPASPVSDPRSDISLRSVSGASDKSGFIPSGTGL